MLFVHAQTLDHTHFGISQWPATILDWEIVEIAALSAPALHTESL